MPKKPEIESTDSNDTSDASGRKGRPTPKRKDAQAANKVNSLAPALTKEAKKQEKENARLRRLESRAAYLRGDENALPLRDRGPVRRYVRDLVDSTRTPGEYMLYVLFALVFILLTIKNIKIQSYVMILMYALLLFLGVQGFIFKKKIIKLVSAKFPEASTKGLGMYAFMRSTQLRKLRAPKPQVKPGDIVK